MRQMAERLDLQEKEIAQLKAISGTGGAEGEELSEQQAHVVEYLENMYEYMTARGFRTNFTQATWRELANLTGIEFMGMMVLVMQIIFSFAFWDACLLDVAIGSYPAYSDPVDVSIFRANALIGDGLPTINVIASMASILLLSQAMGRDTFAALVAPQPIELLFFANERALAGMPEERPKSWTHPHSNFSLVVASMFFLFFQTIRCVIVTTQAGIGAAVSFAAAPDAQDIVLNSSAIAFVLDLDEITYATHIAPDRRAAHRRVAAEMVVEGDKRAARIGRFGAGCSYYHMITSWRDALQIVDIVFLLLIYANSVGLTTNETFADLSGSETISMVASNISYEMLYVIFRGGLIAAAQAMVALSHVPKPTPWRFWLAYLPLKLVLGSFGSLLIRKLFSDLFLVRKLGMGMSALSPLSDGVYRQLDPNGISILDCLGGNADEDVCMNLHKNEALMTKLANDFFLEKTYLASFWPWSMPASQ